jgi:hypothetical protein
MNPLISWLAARISWLAAPISWPAALTVVGRSRLWSTSASRTMLLGGDEQYCCILINEKAIVLYNLQSRKFLSVIMLKRDVRVPCIHTVKKFLLVFLVLFKVPLFYAPYLIQSGSCPVQLPDFLFVAVWIGFEVLVEKEQYSMVFTMVSGKKKIYDLYGSKQFVSFSRYGTLRT